MSADKPNSCGVCGRYGPRDHGLIVTSDGGHHYTEPTDAQRKARMVARRAERDSGPAWVDPCPLGLGEACTWREQNSHPHPADHLARSDTPTGVGVVLSSDRERTGRIVQYRGNGRKGPRWQVRWHDGTYSDAKYLIVIAPPAHITDPVEIPS